MVVTAAPTAVSELDTPAAVSVVNGDEMRQAAPRVNLSESLGAVPGLQVQNRQNYAQDLQLSIRGFGSRSTYGVRGLRIYVDGIPATMPDGQGKPRILILAASIRSRCCAALLCPVRQLLRRGDQRHQPDRQPAAHH
jgi:outer membrane receptor for Fe3+-dicitrate